MCVCAFLCFLLCFNWHPGVAQVPGHDTDEEESATQPTATNSLDTFPQQADQMHQKDDASKEARKETSTGKEGNRTKDSQLLPVKQEKFNKNMHKLKQELDGQAGGTTAKKKKAIKAEPKISKAKSTHPAAPSQPAIKTEPVRTATASATAVSAEEQGLSVWEIRAPPW